MSEHVVKILETYYINHDIKRFVVEKPAGYSFESGQSTYISINLPEWKDKLRPFSFTGLKEWNYLEFIIKIYRDHQGVTNMLGRTNSGAELILHDVFGAIHYKGHGVFIAGGAGITPLISIFRNLYKNKQIRGNKLIYSNKTSADVILAEELRKMLKDNFLNVLTREHTLGYLGRRIDRAFLIATISNFGQPFYLCGPPAFVKDMTANLLDLGATPDTIVFEQ